MKIYTRTGDDGTTAALGGQRLRKDDPRMQAIGEVDELNAALGVVRSSLPSDLPAADTERIDGDLDTLQHLLFDIGCELAVAVCEYPDQLPHTTDANVRELESWIDRYEGDLPELGNFILPAGGNGSAHLHLARGICRRAERQAVSLHASHRLQDCLLQTLNRLSDLLFTMARWVAHRAGQGDTIWRPKRS